MLLIQFVWQITLISILQLSHFLFSEDEYGGICGVIYDTSCGFYSEKFYRRWFSQERKVKKHKPNL